MEQYTLMMEFTGGRTLLLLTKGADELLRASLPFPAHVWRAKPIQALLESLAVWLDTKLPVVLSVTGPANGLSLELTDESGTGLRTPFYEVVTVERLGDRQHDSTQLGLFDLLAGGGR